MASLSISSDGSVPDVAAIAAATAVKVLGAGSCTSVDSVFVVSAAVGEVNEAEAEGSVSIVRDLLISELLLKKEEKEKKEWRANDIIIIIFDESGLEIKERMVLVVYMKL